MKTDQLDWNRKFSSRKFIAQNVEPYFKKNENHLVPGSVLDIASGEGRNSIYFASTGYQVTAADCSDVALSRLHSEAEKNKLSVCTECLDLDNSFPQGKFDNLILSFFKPDDELLDKMISSLNLHSSILICTFNIQQHLEFGFSQKYCLQPGELLGKFAQFECLDYQSFTESGKNLDGYVFHRQPSVALD